MEKNKIEELWQTYICPERKLKRFKQAKEKKRYIKKAYPLEFGPDGKTLLQRGPWTQQEREIYLQICQKHEFECQSNQTKDVFQEILQLIPTRNLTQLKGYHNNHNPFQTIVVKETKRIRRTKLEMSQEKLKEFALKNKRKRQIKQLEKLSNLNNQILTLETQIVQFNLEDGNQIEIKVFINTDLLLNINDLEDQKQEKDEIKTENLDNIIEDVKEQKNLQNIQKDKIVVRLLNPLEVKVENEEVEHLFINKAKQIAFRQLICLIELENKFNNKKQLNELKVYNLNEKPQRILISFKQQQKKDMLQIEEQKKNQEDEQQNSDKQIIQLNQPINTENQQEIIVSPDKQQPNETNKIELHKITNSQDDQKSIILDSQEKANYNQKSILIIDNNQIDFLQQQQQINKSNSLIKSQNKSKSGQDSQIIEQLKEVQQNQDKSNQEDLNQQFQQNKKIEDENKNNSQKQQQQKQILKYIKGEKKTSIEISKKKEVDRQREIEIEKEIQIELEKERLKQIERDKLQEVQRQRKLELQQEKEKQREKLKEKRLQFCNEYDRKERNRTKNRELRSLQELNQQYNKTNNKQSKQLTIQNNQNQKSSEQSYPMKQQKKQDVQVPIQQQMIELQNQQQQQQQQQQQYQYQQQYQQQQQQQQQQLEQNLPTYIPHPFQFPLIDQLQQQQYLMKQVQGNQLYGLNDSHQQLPFVEGYENNYKFSPQYQNLQEQANQNKDLNISDPNPQFPQTIPLQIQNYIQSDRNNGLQQDQINSQPQPQLAFQPPQPFIPNPYFYPQFLPMRSLQQQSQGIIDGQQNLNKDYQVEMMYVFQEVPQNFDPNFFFQFSPQSFVSIPGGSKLGDALK